MKNTRKRYARGASIQPLPSKRVIGNTTIDSGIPDVSPINYTPSSRYVNNSNRNLRQNPTMWDFNNPEGDKILESKDNSTDYNIYEQKVAPQFRDKSSVTVPTENTSSTSSKGNNSENIDNYSGDIANTLALVNNLYNTSKLQTTFKPKYATPPTRVYSSATPLGLYNNAVGARTAIKAMNRYNPTSSNKFGVIASQLDANNQLINQENQNRTGFNNQVVQDRYASSVYNTELDNKLAEMKVSNENAKLANKVNAVNAFSEGQMQNQQYRDRIKLDKEVATLNAAKRDGDIGEYSELYNKSENELKDLYNNATNDRRKERIKNVAKERGFKTFSMGGILPTRKRY